MDYNVNISTAWVVVFVILAIWDLAWRGLGLWHSSQRKDKVWFVILLVVNSVGILPIAYLLLNKNKAA